MRTIAMFVISAFAGMTALLLVLAGAFGQKLFGIIPDSLEKLDGSPILVIAAVIVAVLVVVFVFGCILAVHFLLNGGGKVVAHRLTQFFARA